MDTHARRRPLLDRLVGSVRENLGLKLASLLIAVALFAMVRGTGSVQRPIEVSLVDRPPAVALRRVLLTDLPDSVRVTVRGPPSLVGSLRPDALGPIIADLSDGHRRELRLEASMLRLPAGVQLVQIEPRSIELHWDDVVERDVPVRAELVGSPAPGLEVRGPVDVAPTVVHVTGPALYVEPMPVVHTVPVDITGLSAGAYPRRVPLEPSHHHMRFDAPDGVRVSFAIAPDVIERRFERLPITAVGGGRFELRPPVATLTLTGPPAVVNSIEPAELVLTVDVPRAVGSAAVPRLAIQLAHTPRDTTLVRIEPTDVIAVPTR